MRFYVGICGMRTHTAVYLASSYCDTSSALILLRVCPYLDAAALAMEAEKSKEAPALAKRFRMMAGMSPSGL